MEGTKLAPSRAEAAHLRLLALTTTSGSQPDHGSCFRPCGWRGHAAAATQGRWGCKLRGAWITSNREQTQASPPGGGRQDHSSQAEPSTSKMLRLWPEGRLLTALCSLPPAPCPTGLSGCSGGGKGGHVSRVQPACEEEDLGKAAISWMTAK